MLDLIITRVVDIIVSWHCNPKTLQIGEHSTSKITLALFSGGTENLKAWLLPCLFGMWCKNTLVIYYSWHIFSLMWLIILSHLTMIIFFELLLDTFHIIALSVKL